MTREAAERMGQRFESKRLSRVTVDWTMEEWALGVRPKGVTRVR